MESKIKKKYPYVGEVLDTEENRISTFAHTSPWKKAKTAFVWTNFEYPLYHSHTDWELQIVLNDKILQDINGTETVLSAGTACLVGPKDQHAVFYPNGKKNQFQGLNFIARDSHVREILNTISSDLYGRLLNASQARIISLPSSLLEEISNTCLEIQGTDSRSTPYAEEQCNILFQSLLLRFLTQRTPTNAIPNELIAFIRSLNNPKLPPEDLKELQAQLPYSYSNLTRLFKKYMGCTITQYVNNIKLQYAKELLATTTMTSLMITAELHFESISHFNHLFKAHFQMTPTEYRKQSRQQLD